MALQSRMQMRIRFVEQQHVEFFIQGQSVHAQPLQKTAPFNHQILSWRSSFLAKTLVNEVPIPKADFDRVMIEVIELGHVESDFEDFLKGLEQLFPRVFPTNSRERPWGNTAIATFRLFEPRNVLLPEVIEDVPKHRSSKAAADQSFTHR